MIFIDNDIIVKLASWDLLGDALDTLGKSARDVRILATAKFQMYVAKNQEKGTKRYGPSTHDRIRDFVANAPEADGDVHVEDSFLFELLNIDYGEAFLFSAASRLPNSIITTGDKRSLRALAKHSECSALMERLSGRVICLEQILLRCIVRFGFDYLAAKVTNATSIDTFVRTVFGVASTTSEADVIAALAAEIESLRSNTRGLLATE